MSVKLAGADLTDDSTVTGYGNIIEGALMSSTGSETVSWIQPQGWREVPTSSTLYGRLQYSSTVDSTLSLAAYGVYL